MKWRRESSKRERQKKHDEQKRKEKDRQEFFGKKRFDRLDRIVSVLFFLFFFLVCIYIHFENHFPQVRKLLFFGDGECSPSFGRGNPSYGSKELKRALVSRALLIMVDEFRTSKLCSCCHESVLLVPPLSLVLVPS
jgi:hypothetical protein